MSIAPGTKLGQYEVQDFIGQGAMGLVYRAYHSQLERTGAVKILQAIAPDPDTTARFRHEAQAIAQMRHPNILNVYDFGEFNGSPYMIVEYVPGGSLADRLRRGQIDQAAALRYLRGIATGLDYAHKHGVVHRDIKPANVLLESDDTPVIADFGLAKLLQGSSLKSMTGVTTGTPAYMAPEQVTGSRVGPPADRYSLATIAYEMLAGAIPFDGEALMELLYAQVHREPPAPSSRNPALSPQVDAVIMRGLAKDPNARWESSAAFVDALEAACAGLGTPAVERTVVMAPAFGSTVPFSQLGPVAAVQTAPRSSPSLEATVAVGYPPPAPPLTKRKSHKRLWVIASVAMVLLLVLSLGVCAAINQKPTLSLSPDAVMVGESVVVRATHVPANQNGEIHLQSQLHIFLFHAGANGDVSTDITVPRDVGFGDHLVSICWGGSCRAQAILHVVPSIVLTTPTPSAGSSPTAIPPPVATPTAHPTAPPVSTPTSTPTHPPTPTPKQSPTPTPPPPVISVSNYNIKILTGTETVYGLHFSPGSKVTITFIQGATTNMVVGTPTVSSSGYFSLTFKVPATAVLGPAHIKVCGTSGCLDATVNVALTG